MENTWTKVRAVYFSPTGTTKKIVTTVAGCISMELKLPKETYDFTPPAVRKEGVTFGADEIVVFGIPTYAGRIPNVLLKYLATVKADGALAVPVALYGNRNFDDSLIELRNLLEANGFHTVAGAAFIGEHSFSKILGKDRPDVKDMMIAGKFGKEAAEKIRGITDVSALLPVEVKGETPIRTYYQPRDRKGNPIDIRKVLPKTKANCINCGICADVCPMGSISRDNVAEFTGICIKCGACIKQCPVEAKYYDDEGYLYHKTELELGYERRAEPETFL